VYESDEERWAAEAAVLAGVLARYGDDLPLTRAFVENIRLIEDEPGQRFLALLASTMGAIEGLERRLNELSDTPRVAD
jgi:hypothetical protein